MLSFSIERVYFLMLPVLLKTFLNHIGLFSPFCFLGKVQANLLVSNYLQIEILVGIMAQISVVEKNYLILIQCILHEGIINWN